MRPGVDVVVVSYHTPLLLDKFLLSHSKWSPNQSSLYVRVNDPSPDDFDVIDSWGDMIDGAWLGENWGYARSVNSLAARGDREAIAIFNADVELLESAVRDCFCALMENEDWGVLGPQQRNSKGKMTHAGIFGTNESPSLRGFMRRPLPEYDEVSEAVSVSGSAYFIKRSVWDELSTCPLYQGFCEAKGLTADGAFLPTQHYYEETYCSYHAREHGHKVMYYGPSCLLHEWHQSSKQGAKETDGQIPVARQLFREACDHHGIRHD